MYLLIQPFSVSAMGQVEQLLVDKREGCLLYHFLQVIWVYLCCTITIVLFFPLLPLMWQHLHMRHCPVMRKNASPMVWWESGEHMWYLSMWVDAIQWKDQNAHYPCTWLYSTHTHYQPFSCHFMGPKVLFLLWQGLYDRRYWDLAVTGQSQAGLVAVCVALRREGSRE